MKPSFLVIQTAFIGDVILATAVLEKLHQHYPESSIDFLVRQGNEGLVKGHPFLRRVWVWNKKEGKIKNLVNLIRAVRHERYDYVINLHRFASSGFVTAFSGAKTSIGFSKNPLSFLFSRRVKHEIGTLHEVERNQQLIESLTDAQAARPKLYPSVQDRSTVEQYIKGRYLCVAPTSVWFTKQWPAEKWIEFLKLVSPRVDAIYILGAPSDRALCDEILQRVSSPNVVNLAGQLSFLASAALMEKATMNYVNDSAPMHIASSMNAPVAAIYCSTVPSFGFGPLSEKSSVIETSEILSCRPCGLHGYKACPEGHFRCATTIRSEQLLDVLE